MAEAAGIRRALVVVPALTTAFALLLAPAAAGQAGGAADGPSDVLVISGAVTVRDDDAVGDVLVVDGPVEIEGEVRGDVVAVTGTVRIAGSVGGDVVTVAGRTTAEPGARIGGDLIYIEERPVVAEQARVTGEITRLDTDALGRPAAWAGRALAWLAVSGSALLLGLALLLLAPRALRAADDVAATRLGAAAGWGLAAVLGLPLLAAALLFTLVAIPLAIALFLALVPLYAVGYTTGAWLAGRRLTGRRQSPVLSFLVGLAGLRLLALVPVLGAVVGFAAVVAGLGTLAVALWRARDSAGKARTVTA